MSKKLRTFYLIISLAALLNVLCLPMFDEGGGMMPTDAEYNFIRVVGDALMEKGALSLWVVQMTLCVFAPCVIMLATALTRMRLLYSFSSILGLLAWFVNFFRYALKTDFITLFDVNKTDISIGSWVAVLLFLINTLVIICVKKAKEAEAEEEEPEEEEE